MTATTALTPVELVEKVAVAIGMGQTTARQFAGHFMEQARQDGLTVSAHLPTPSEMITEDVPLWEGDDVPAVTAEQGKVIICPAEGAAGLFELDGKPAQIFGHRVRAAAPWALRQAAAMAKEADQ